MFDKIGHYYVLMIENERVIKVIPLGSKRREFQLKLDQENPMLEAKLYYQNNTEDCLIRVGDFAPNSSVYGDNTSQLRRENEVHLPRSRNKYDEDFDNRLELCFQFLRNVKGRPELITNIQARLDSDTQNRNDDEAVYRCLYNSFKMYRIRDNILIYARLSYELVGGTPSMNDLEFITQLQKHKFSKVYTQLVKDAVKCDFTLDRNEHSKWSADAQVLFSALFITQKALTFLLRFAERINNNTLFLESTRSLDWDEAGAMETWDALAILRSNKKAQEAFRALLK